jgi:lysophospholipase L1-like esterase
LNPVAFLCVLCDLCGEKKPDRSRKENRVLKLTLIGDSIRMGYEPFVRELLAERAEVWGPEENGGDSRNVLAHLKEWALTRRAGVIHFNCGLHDIRVNADGAYQVPIEEYASNVRSIVELLVERTRARLIWATLTPIHDDRHNGRKDIDFKRYEADVERYNRAALEVVNRAALEVDDLHGLVERHGIPECLSADGVHMTERGYRLLAEAVAKMVLP